MFQHRRHPGNQHSRAHAECRGTPQPVDQVKNRLKRGRRGGRPSAFDAVAFISSATSSSAPSAISASTVPSPPGTTNATTSGGEPLTWPRSGSGSVTPSHDLRDTLQRTLTCVNRLRRNGRASDTRLRTRCSSRRPGKSRPECQDQNSSLA